MLGTQVLPCDCHIWKKIFKPGIYFPVLSFSWNVHFLTMYKTIPSLYLQEPEMCITF